MSYEKELLKKLKESHSALSDWLDDYSSLPAHAGTKHVKSALKQIRRLIDEYEDS